MTTLLKGRIEAILFLTGRALSVHDIAEKLGMSVDDVEEALLELISDYSCREDSSLEIDDTDGYILQVRDTYTEVVNQMMPVELSIAILRTLSAVALYGPMKQSTLIESRGASAYDHIKTLLAQQLVSRRRKERSYILSVTPKFYEYFKLTGDKEELKELVAKLPTTAEDLPADDEAPMLLEAVVDEAS